MRGLAGTGEDEGAGEKERGGAASRLAQREREEQKGDMAYLIRKRGYYTKSSGSAFLPSFLPIPASYPSSPNVASLTHTLHTRILTQTKPRARSALTP